MIYLIKEKDGIVIVTGSTTNLPEKELDEWLVKIIKEKVENTYGRIK